MLMLVFHVFVVFARGDIALPDVHMPRDNFFKAHIATQVKIEKAQVYLDGALMTAV